MCSARQPLYVEMTSMTLSQRKRHIAKLAKHTKRVQFRPVTYHYNYSMEAREAVNLAIKYVKDLFEPITNVGLEEIEFDETAQNWLITIGFNRSWQHATQDIVSLINAKTYESHRVYKVVKVSNGKIVSVKNRPTQVLA